MPGQPPWLGRPVGSHGKGGGSERGSWSPAGLLSPQASAGWDKGKGGGEMPVWPPWVWGWQGGPESLLMGLNPLSKD